MLRFLCRLINLITPKKWELVESTDVKKTASNLHCSPVSPQASPWTLPRHLLCSLCIPSSFLWKSFCSPRTPWICASRFNSKGAPGGWTNICLHISPQWYVGRRFVKTNVGHFDDQILQLPGMKTVWIKTIQKEKHVDKICKIKRDYFSMDKPINHHYAINTPRYLGICSSIMQLPSGYLTVCHGKSPFLSSVNHLFLWAMA